MRGGPGRADAAGDGDTVGKAGAVEALAKVGGQLVLAAVKMRAAADVEQQAVGRVTSNERRIAQAPIGDFFQERGVGRGVFLDRVQRRMHGARLRQRETRVQAEPFRCFVDGDDRLGIAAFAVDHHSTSPRVGRVPPRAPPPHPLPVNGEREKSRDLPMRSVASRHSHRQSRRCEGEALIAVTPFENPCAERAAAVAHELAAKHGLFLRRSMRDGRRRADDPARGGGGGFARRPRAQQQSERAAIRGGQRQPA